MWEGLLDSAQMIAVKEVELDIAGQKAQSVSVSMKLAAAYVQRPILKYECSMFKRQFVSPHKIHYSASYVYKFSDIPKNCSNRLTLYVRKLRLVWLSV